MGANASKSSERGGEGRGRKNQKDKANRVNQQKIEDLVDLGAVFPNGLYTTTTEQDYDPRIVRSLIIARKIAPFYKGLAEAPETVTVPLSTTLSPPPLPPLPQSTSSLSTISVESSPTSSSTLSPKNTNNSPNIVGRPRSASTTSRIKDASYDPYVERRKAYVEKMKQREKMLYNDAVECPICFLYYPANINYSRCCDQPICTECFVQIHRPIETPSCPATCPFCMEENYGVLYETPLWSEKFQARSRSGSHSTMTGTRHTTSGVSSETDGPRRESVSHKNPDVVLIDHIRPNWNTNPQPAPTPARAVSRRNSASAGTRSNGNNLLRAAGGVGSLLTRPGRSASSAAATEYNQFLTNIRDVNMDLEDWMVMEAIRLSLAEQEENERKEALKKLEEEKKKKKAVTGQEEVEGGGESSTSTRVLNQQPTTSASPTPLHLFDQNQSSSTITSQTSSGSSPSSRS